MSDDDNSPNPRASNRSSDTSPTDTRAEPRRFEPILPDNDDDYTTTTGTVRRNRPPAISTSSTPNYGTFTTHRFVYALEECR